jgi:3-methyladenine DNA glycosylase AlkD
MNFSTHIQQQLQQQANASFKEQMEAYMKHKFTFFGVKAPVRKHILKESINLYKTEATENCRTITLELYNLPERELHYCAMELLARFLKNKYALKDIQLIQKLITTYSWWDTVDFIAKHILGNYLLKYPTQTQSIISNFSNHNNMWLNRSAILFQLGYKDKTDVNLLFSLCKKHAASKEFFIQKAVGWSLREYTKTNPQAVEDFVKNTTLAPLSKREALKNL